MEKRGIRKKLVLLFACMALLLPATIGYTTYRYNYSQAERQYVDIARGSGKEVSLLLSGERVQRYHDGEKDAGYDDMWRLLQSIKQSFGLKYLYVMVPNLEDGSATMVFDIYLDGEDLEAFSQFGEHIAPQDPSLLLVFDSAFVPVMLGELDEKTAITRGEFGYVVSAYTPLKTEYGRVVAIVGSDIEMSLILDEAVNQTVRVALTAAAIILVFMAILLVAVNRQIIMPIHVLSAHMGSFLKNSDAFTSVNFPIRFRDEFETMADSFKSMIEELRVYMANVANVAADQERIATEMNVAVDIRESLLPKLIEGDNKFGVSALLNSAREVGGDFYDFFYVDERRVGVLVANVLGSGIPAALFMMVAKTMIKAQMTSDISVDKAVSAVNTHLYESNRGNMPVAAFVGVLDIDTGSFSYVNAGGSRPLILRKGGGFEWLRDVSASVLALNQNVVYMRTELTLRQGDQLFLYTDGVTALRNPSGRELGRDTLREMLNTARLAGKRGDEMLRDVNDGLNAFIGEAERTKDATMLLLTYEKGDRKLAEISVPARAESVKHVLPFIKNQLNENGLGGAFYAGVAIALEEVFVMVAGRVSGKENVTVSCGVNGGRVEIKLLYGGRLENVLESNLATERDVILFIRKHANELGYSVQEGKNVLIIVKEQ